MNGRARGRADRRYAQARVQICRAARRLEGEHIQQNALETGLLFKNALIDAAKRHPCLGDVRGAGFFIGADIVKPGTKEPDYEHAVDFIEAMREHHVLTSPCGPAGNILKIRPPLVFSPNDVDRRATRRWPQEDAQASVRVYPCHWHHLHVFTCGGDGGGGGSARHMRPLPRHGGRLPRAVRSRASLMTQGQSLLPHTTRTAPTSCA